MTSIAHQNNMLPGELPGAWCDLVPLAPFGFPWEMDIAHLKYPSTVDPASSHVWRIDGHMYIYICMLYVQIASYPISKAPPQFSSSFGSAFLFEGWIDLTSPIDVNHDWDIPRYWYTNCNHSLSNLYHYIENSLRDGQSGSIAGLTFEPQMIAKDFGVPKKTIIIQPLVSPVLVDVPYRKIDQIM